MTSRFQNTAAMKIIIPMNGPGQGSVHSRSTSHEWRITKRHRMSRLSRDSIPAHDKGAHVSRLSFLVIPTSRFPLLLSSTPEYLAVPRPDCPSWRAIYGRVFTLNSVLTVLTIFASHLRPGLCPVSCVSTLFCGEKCSSW